MRAIVLFALLTACSEEAEHFVCATPEHLAATADITITAQDTVITPRDTGFVAWSYDGDVPGPVLRIPLGESRTVKLVNHSPRPASLHFHGLSYTADDDGDPDHPLSVVNPGCAHVYTLKAVAAGVWPYHSHVDSRNEMARGLYGAVIVPAAGEMPAAHEYVVLLGQLNLEMAGMAGGGDPTAEIEHGEGGGDAEHFFATINGLPDGKANVIELVGNQYIMRHDDMVRARVGDRVRFRVANISPDDLHTFHIHGHRWDAGGGVFADNVALAPAQGTTVEFVEDNPGEWMYHCHVLDHVGDGMWAMYHVEPFPP